MELRVITVEKRGLLRPNPCELSQKAEKSVVVFGNILPRRAQSGVPRRLGSRQHPLTAVVDRRHARHGPQQGIQGKHVIVVPQGCHDAVYIVVVGEVVAGYRLSLRAGQETVGAEEAVQRVGDLEVVRIVVARPQPLVALVVRDAVESARRGECRVVPVNDLPQEPECRRLVGDTP